MANINIPSLTAMVEQMIRPVCDTLPGDYGGSVTVVKAFEETPGLLPLLNGSDAEDVIVDSNGTIDPTRAAKVKYVLAFYTFHKAVVNAYEVNVAASGQPVEHRVLNAINVLAINPFKNVFAIMAPRPAEQNFGV